MEQPVSPNWPMSPNWIVVCSALALLAASSPARGDVAFVDTEFSNTTWGFETATAGPGGTSVPSQVGGGNPGFARQVVNTVNSGGGATIFGFSRYGATTATRYDPVAQGAILSIDWSIDSRWLSGIGGQGRSIMLGAKQGSILYFADYDITSSDGLWHPRGAFNLAAPDFQPLFAGPAIDFSAAGAPLRFGFIVGNSGDTPYSNTAVYDNFSLTIHNLPAPPIGGTAAGLAVLAGTRRRR